MHIEKQAYSPKEVSKILGICLNGVYEAIRQGQIPTIKVGGKLLTPKVALDKMLASATITVTPVIA